MTLVAFATYGDKAEILTDTTSYGSSLVTMGHTSKVMPLPHLDAAVLSQGSSEFGTWVDHFAKMTASEAPNFESFMTDAQGAARDAWEFVSKMHADQGLAEPAPSAAFYIGPIGETFKAFTLSSTDDFEPVETKGLSVMPVPLNPPMRITEHEARYLSGFAHENDVAVLRDRPAGKAPASMDDWVALGLAARQTRALAPVESRLKVLVAGALHHTRLRRGLVTTRTVHTFNDTGEEFWQIVRGTLHPVAQLGPCHECESGKRWIDCHLRESFTEPCLCKSGKTLEDCCLVTAA